MIDDYIIFDGIRNREAERESRTTVALLWSLSLGGRFTAMAGRMRG